MVSINRVRSMATQHDVVGLDEEIHAPSQPVGGQQRDPWILAFWGIVFLAFCLRLYDLASMPLHHDESLYGVYCWRFFIGQGYHYDPMMHGPFMFHFQLLIFFLFGVGDFSVRIAPALLGTALIASTYSLKAFVGRVGIVLIALFLTCSPTHLYFSRFMRHDSYMAFFTYTSAVFGVLYYHTRRKTHLYLTAASLALMFCVKENSYIHAFIFVTFVIIKELCHTYL
ncbi:TIGR03663 family protein, partial [candidate division KSB3 bacterium]|nr:TIGR03663 family protein [candidate division KSB3 bacterium]MBD3324867.1 TIGR03663 family protein [candidate division KSB3 bacterium]